MKAKERLSKWLKALEIEKEADRKYYQESVLKRSLSERCDRGTTWYPIVVNKIYIGTAEKYIVELERTRNLGEPHVLQPGSIAGLFGMDGEKQIGQLSGVVQSVRRNSMKLALNTEELPQWIHKARMGVTLLFDDTTYREMEHAMKQTIEAKGNRLSELREAMLGQAEPSFYQLKENYQHSFLNPSQNEAIRNILCAQDLAIIHGPPGTGKTTTIVQAIAETLRKEAQVLVCAPSNTAVDLLAEKCGEEGLNVLRLGNPIRVEESVLQHTLDSHINNHPNYGMLRKLRKEAEDIRRRALKFKRNYNREARDERYSLLREAREIKDQARTLEAYITDSILREAQVIACTMVGAASSILGRRKFSTLFIDEAAQALAPACLIPITRAKRVVFAGDHCQLPPTVKSEKAVKQGLSKTLFEHCIEHKEVDVMLNEQYRMHQQIMYFSSKQFYDGELKAAEAVKRRTLGEGFTAFEFVDTAGCGFNERQNPESRSTENIEEANLLLRHLAMLFNRLETAGKLQKGFTIGLIAPYKAQVIRLKEQILDSPMLESYREYLNVNTVDGFQGQERDVIYISLTRSNAKAEIGFLKDVRRMNVALTRAKKKLVVVGDSATIGEHPFYKAFIEYAESMDAYKSAWEYMYEA